MAFNLGFSENFGTSLFNPDACRDALIRGEKALLEGAHPKYIEVVRKFGTGMSRLAQVTGASPVSANSINAREERVFGEILTAGSVPRRLLLWERLSR